MDAGYVEKSSSRSHSSCYITELIQEENLRNPMKAMNAMNVIKLSSRNSISLFIREFTQGKNPVSVNVCDKAFVQKLYLIIHQRTHIGEKPYKCDKGSRAFSKRSKVTVHQRTHLG